jgi:hypothetical protein
MIFHSNLAVVTLKQKTGRRAEEVICFLPQGQLETLAPWRKIVKKKEILYEYFSI